MVLKVQKNANDVQVYTVSGAGSKSIPDWLARKNRKTLRNDAEYKSRIELLQDFEFPEASNKIRLSRDGQFAIATGTYKPTVKVYEFAQMSNKFERVTSTENVTLEILSDDWTKSAHLQTDRSIELHTAGGVHYSTRVPTFGRDLKYHYPSADLLVGASSNEVYRLNLDHGRFLNPFYLDTASKGVNALDICPAHQLFGFATHNGTIEFWDPRYRSRIGLLDLNTPNEPVSMTAFKFAADGLNLAVGASNGTTTLFDLRSPQPMLVKDQGYGLPIKVLHYLTSPASDSSSRILSADSKIIKIWDAKAGTPYTSIEPPNDINDVQPIPGSGLMFVANEGIPMHTFYVPSLGPAPRWCSFLDNLTEELEETEMSVYANYRFVSRKELADLGLKHLVGTNVVRSYMHGYFIDFRLYEKAKLISNPFEYVEHRQKQIASKIDKERESRIRSSKKTKVNNTLANRLLAKEELARAKGEKIETSAVEDSRFKGAFNDADFVIDEESHEFNILNPTRSKTKGLTAAESEEEERVDLDSSSSESESEPEEDTKPTEETGIRTIRVKPPKEKAPKMRIVKEDTNKPSTQVKQTASFASRLTAQQIRDAREAQIKENIKHDVAGKGTKEMTFTSHKKPKFQQREGKQKQQFKGRRAASGNVLQGRTKR